MFKSLNDSVQYIKGVGPKLSKYLEKIDIKTVNDCLYFFPRAYADRRNLPTISLLLPNKKQAVVGKIKSLFHQRTRNYKDIIKGVIYDHTGSLNVVWFNQAYLMRVLKKEMNIFIEGKVEGTFYDNNLQMISQGLEILSGENDALSIGRIIPKYSLTEGLYQRRMRLILYNVLKNYFPLMQDYLPADLKKSLLLLDFKQAILNLHFPADRDFFRQAKRRIIFDEFFFIQLAFALKQRFVKSFSAAGFIIEGNLISKFTAKLPFLLTNDQKNVIREIVKDLSSEKPMNRLLQGDVGCGKTIVAAYACIVAVQNNYRVVIMAPTEILAYQHYRRFQNLFDPFKVKVGLIMGGVNNRSKIKAIIDESQIIIGTHALIQDDVVFHKLGLVIIDEQHKFGVIQRQILRQKTDDQNKIPHLLVMTATPIPRTLALSCYGDLDRSTIFELPPGRTPVKTFFHTAENKSKVYELVRGHLKQGRQTYIVYPLVEESEKLELSAAVKMAKKLQEDEFRDFKVGLIHGQMPKDEKDEIMGKFNERHFDVLVATTVIEVGLDVPNANCMVIEHAERFGLSTLHQLRGRIGRGNDQSFCYLIGYPQTTASRMRLGAMVKKTNGFEIAEIDLKIRGQGEILGTRQSGLPELKLANLVRDEEILKQARKSAFSMITADPNLSFPQHQKLKEELVRRCKDFLTPGLLD
jgi:ATP-dependent DNA helicase RecG